MDPYGVARNHAERMEFRATDLFRPLLSQMIHSMMQHTKSRAQASVFFELCAVVYALKSSMAQLNVASMVREWQREDAVSGRDIHVVLDADLSNIKLLCSALARFGYDAEEIQQYYVKCKKRIKRNKDMGRSRMTDFSFRRVSRRGMIYKDSYR